MTDDDTRPIRQSLKEEIGRIIGDASRHDHILSSGQEAMRLASLYLGSGLTPDEICDRVIEAAIHAGVTIEMSRPDNGGSSGPGVNGV